MNGRRKNNEHPDEHPRNVFPDEHPEEPPDKHPEEPPDEHPRNVFQGEHLRKRIQIEQLQGKGSSPQYLLLI
tara:strand:+ start:3251 stop:3466 length:216 start_codon:yes stop_codon:yes gene_type:complete